MPTDEVTDEEQAAAEAQLTDMIRGLLAAAQSTGAHGARYHGKADCSKCKAVQAAIHFLWGPSDPPPQGEQIVEFESERRERKVADEQIIEFEKRERVAG